MNYSKLIILFFAGLLALIITSCDVSSDNTELDSNVGQLVIQITDAPLNFPNIKEINLTIEDIAVRSAENGEFLLLQDDQVNLNIMNFRNGDTRPIANSGRVPPGSFDQLQLQFTGITIELEDSDDAIDVAIDPRAQDGYTIDFNPEIEVLGARNTTILLDLNLYQSFTQQNEGENFFPSISFDPVIRYAQLGNTGSINGKVLDEGNKQIRNALVKLLNNNELVATTFSEKKPDSNSDKDPGDFKFIGIEPGTFQLTVEKEGLQKDTLETEVEMQSETNVSFRLDSTATANN